MRRAIKIVSITQRNRISIIICFLIITNISFASNYIFKIKNNKDNIIEIDLTEEKIDENIKREYIIQKGDTLSKLAKKLKNKIKILKKLNNISNIDYIRADSLLNYYAKKDSDVYEKN